MNDWWNCEIKSAQSRAQLEGGAGVVAPGNPQHQVSNPGKGGKDGIDGKGGKDGKKDGKDGKGLFRAVTAGPAGVRLQRINVLTAPGCGGISEHRGPAAFPAPLPNTQGSLEKELRTPRTCPFAVQSGHSALGSVQRLGPGGVSSCSR